MREYDMPIEEQLKLLARKFDSFDTRLDSVDNKLDGVGTKLERVDARLDSIDVKLSGMDGQIGTLSTETKTLASNINSLTVKVESIAIGLDETHAVAKLGLEAVQGLEESMNDRFDEMKKANKADTQLLKDVLVHVRKRVAVIERPKARGRQ